MGVIKSGILGGFSGKVGGVVGSSWKGISTIKAMPQSVYNPRTNAQVANRDRFSFVRNLAADCLTTIVKPLNDRFAQRMSGYNLFCSRSANAWVQGPGFNPSGLIICAGKLGDAVITTFDPDVTEGIQVSWSPVPVGNYESVSDKAFVLVLDNNGNIVGVSSGFSDRMVGGVLIQPAVPLVPATTYCCYLAFMRQDGTMVSNQALEIAPAHN